MIYCLCAKYQDGHISCLFWTDCLEDALYGFRDYRVAGSSVFVNFEPDYDKIIDVFVFQRLT